MSRRHERARPRRVAGVAVLLVGAWFAISALTSAPGLAQVPAPADFRLPRADGSPGEVTFSHAKHRLKVDKCSTCHMRGFKMKRGASGPITLAAKQEGRFCGACHDGKTTIGGAVVFPIDQCESCHRD